MTGLVDNDVLLKLASYGLFRELLEPAISTKDVGVLGAAKYVLRKAIQKRIREDRRKDVEALLDEFIAQANVIEPTDEEQAIAADLEAIAQRAGAALDTGESQLCAVLIVRELSQLFTGDKRAIEALEMLLDTNEKLNALSGKIICLEQLVLESVAGGNCSVIRGAICAEADADKVLAICFSCQSDDANPETVEECLNSYLRDLHRKAPRLFLIDSVTDVDRVRINDIGN